MPSTRSSSGLEARRLLDRDKAFLPTFPFALAIRSADRAIELAEIVPTLRDVRRCGDLPARLTSSSTTGWRRLVDAALQAIGSCPRPRPFAPCGRWLEPAPSRWSFASPAGSMVSLRPRDICGAQVLDLPESSISLATVTPSLVIGSPERSSRTDVCALGAEGDLTASARCRTQRACAGGLP